MKFYTDVAKWIFYKCEYKNLLAQQLLGYSSY